MVFSLADEKQSYGCNCESNEKSRSNPMGNSLGVPVGNAVSESQCNEAHTDKADNAKGIEKLVFIAEFLIHILCVDYYAAACENSPEPEMSLVVFAKKRQSAQLGSGIVAPEKGQCKTVNKCKQKPDDTQRFIKDFFSVHLKHLLIRNFKVL